MFHCPISVIFVNIIEIARRLEVIPLEVSDVVKRLETIGIITEAGKISLEFDEIDNCTAKS